MTTNTNTQEDTMTGAIADDNVTDIDGHDVTAIADLADDVAADIIESGTDAPKRTRTAKAKATPKNAIPAGRLSSREVAEALGVAPARLRVYLRSTGSKFTPVGSGARYSFTKTDLAALKKSFPAWEKKMAAEKAAKK